MITELLQAKDNFGRITKTLHEKKKRQRRSHQKKKNRLLWVESAKRWRSATAPPKYPKIKTRHEGRAGDGVEDLPCWIAGQWRVRATSRVEAGLIRDPESTAEIHFSQKKRQKKVTLAIIIQKGTVILRLSVLWVWIHYLRVFLWWRNW